MPAIITDGVRCVSLPCLEAVRLRDSILVNACRPPQNEYGERRNYCESEYVIVRGKLSGRKLSASFNYVVWRVHVRNCTNPTWGEAKRQHDGSREYCGASITEIKTISTLTQEGSMTAGEISNRLHITTSGVTNLIDRPASKQIVRHVPDSKDWRKLIIEVSVEAMSDGDNVYKSMGKSYTKLLSTYTDERLEFLIDYHEHQIRMMKREIAKLSNDA